MACPLLGLFAQIYNKFHVIRQKDIDGTGYIHANKIEGEERETNARTLAKVSE
jgi:hypothetical protein